MNAQHAANISASATRHAQFAAECTDPAMARYHRAEVVAWAKALVTGLTIAALRG